MRDRDGIRSGLVLIVWVFGLSAWLSLLYFWWTAVNTPDHVTYVRWNEFHEFWIEGVLIHGTVIGWIVIFVRHVRALSKKQRGPRNPDRVHRRRPSTAGVTQPTRFGKSQRPVGKTRTAGKISAGLHW